MRYFLGVMLFVIGLAVIEWNITENKRFNSVLIGALGYTIALIGTTIFVSNFE